MKIDVRFKNIDHSDSLTTWTMERISHIPQLKMDPDSLMVCYSLDGRVKCADVTIHCFELSFFAKAEGDNFHQAFDKALQKAIKQVDRKKGKVKSRHVPAVHHKAS